MVGNGMGAKNGILFKTAVSLEETGKVEIVALDKTGTITSGEPKVTDMIPAKGIGETELLETACALEEKSEHPLARAVLEKARERKISARPVSDFRALPGNGLTAVLDNQTVSGGNLTFISTQSEVSEDLKIRSERLAEEGKTPLFFSRDGKRSEPRPV